MTHPREAVYDVLLSQRTRAAEVAQQRADDEWARYEEANLRAASDYRRRVAPATGTERRS